MKLNTLKWKCPMKIECFYCQIVQKKMQKQKKFRENGDCAKSGLTKY